MPPVCSADGGAGCLNSFLVRAATILAAMTPKPSFPPSGRQALPAPSWLYQGGGGVKSYADVTPALVERARTAAAASGVGIAVDGTYVELSYADEDKRRAEVAKVLSQIPVARALGAGCMGSETTNMAKQPGVTRKEAQEALLRSLGEILPPARSRECSLPWSASTTMP